MSSYEQPDSRQIEQARLQIQSLINEIQQLSRQNLSPGQFYSEFLNRVVQAVQANGGVVWTTGENGQLGMQYQLNLQEIGVMQDEEKNRRHARLLYKVLGNPDVAGGKGVLIPPNSGFGDDDAANPTDRLLLFGPMRTDLEMVGLVEVFQRPDTTPQVQQGYLRFLVQMCELAGDFLKGHQLRSFSDRQVLWAKLEEFTRTVHASLNPLEAAYTISNEARRLIECDRVSVALRKGSRCTIEAVSGQDVFDKRSNTVRLLGHLASAVVATREPVWYTGDTRDMAPQVEVAVQEYVDEAHSKMIAVLPLGRPKPSEDAEKHEKEDAEGPVGALIVEQIEDNRIMPAMAQRIEVVCQHSSMALANAVEHQSLFLMPLWRAIGKSKVVVKARTLPKTIAIVSAVLAVIVALFIIPYPYQLSAKGTLEAVDRREVFAIGDGMILLDSGSKIKDGSIVKAGQPLLKLRNPTVASQVEEIKGKWEAEEQHVRDLARVKDNPMLKPEDRQRQTGEWAEALVQAAGFKKQLDIQQEKAKDLEIFSPINGQIVTWDVERLLDKRPVQKGQSLLRIAETAGNWELVLRMSEDRMGDIMRAKKIADERGERLKVSYMLATDPGRSLEGTVKEIKPSAEIVDKDEGNVVEIIVEINKDDIHEADRLSGATVNGKVLCGRASLGYCWFHDVFAFIQAKVLFRFF